MYCCIPNFPHHAYQESPSSKSTTLPLFLAHPNRYQRLRVFFMVKPKSERWKTITRKQNDPQTPQHLHIQHRLKSGMFLFIRLSIIRILPPSSSPHKEIYSPRNLTIPHQFPRKSPSRRTFSFKVEDWPGFNYSISLVFCIFKKKFLYINSLIWMLINWFSLLH